MNKMRFTLSGLTAFLFIITCATAGQASAQRTFVAGPGIGNDTNTSSDCSFSAPCRNFSAAYTVTNTGGEIIALSPGVGYGGLTITHAITVTGLPGQVAFVAVTASTTGFTVSAGASDLVVVQNITFNGSGAGGSTGLAYTSGSLTIQGCAFNQLTTGVSISNTTARVNVKQSRIQSNTTGILVTGGKVAIEDCFITQNTLGVRADGDGGSQNTPPNGTTLVYINGGDITLNTTGLQMNSPGLKQGGGNNGWNIFVRVSNGVPFTNIIANGTALVITGNTSQCGADPCASPAMGTYVGQGF
jgi:hypothetical protein